MDWTDQEIAAQFLACLKDRFEAENAKHRAQEKAEIDELRKNRKYNAHTMEVRDSLLWDIFTHMQVTTRQGQFQALLPNDFVISIEFLQMFEGIETGWSKVGVVCVDNHVAVQVLLIDHWNQEKHNNWLADEEARRHGYKDRHGR